jgi:hypothetical protein
MNDELTPNLLMEQGKWEEYCELNDINPWVVNEGLLDGDELL